MTFGSFAMEICESCQVGNEAALSGIFHVPEGSPDRACLLQEAFGVGVRDQVHGFFILEVIKMLETGTKAPEFTLPDQNGEMHSLSDYKGKKVLLYFYPRDNTSGCTKQACGYSERRSAFEKKGVVILGVSKDSVASHKRFEEKQDLTITLLSDAELEVIKAYDVWHEKKMCGKVSMGVVRTTYLIDEKGIIIKANDKVKAADDPEKMQEEI